MEQKKMTRSKELTILTAAGAAGFWVANFAISRTPIAAEYRAALSISYYPMLLESLVGGLIFGFCVSYGLLRFFDRLPTQNPVLKSVILSLIALLFATILIEVPSKFLTPVSDPVRYFMIGSLFNIIRIPALGFAIGCLYNIMDGKVRK